MGTIPEITFYKPSPVYNHWNSDTALYIYIEFTRYSYLSLKYSCFNVHGFVIMFICHWLCENIHCQKLLVNFPSRLPIFGFLDNKCWLGSSFVLLLF